MAAHTREMLSGVFFLVLCVAVNCDTSRKITTTLNYECGKIPECSTGVNGSFSNLVYIKAVGPKDILHYAISTIGPPTVLVFQTSMDENIKLNVNWENLLSNDSEVFSNNSITLSDPKKIIYSYAVVFTKLIEYNDTDDAADLTHYPMWNSTHFNDRDFTEFEWMKLSTKKSDSNTVVFNSTVWSMDSDMLQEDQPRNYTPSLSFVFRTSGNESREDSLPHLLYNENVTQFDFTLDNFPAKYNSSRFALELAIFSDGGKKETMTIDESESIDDEYTPGVFRINNIRTKPSDQSKGGFMQWKPVCYTDVPKQRSTATKTQKYKLRDIKEVSDMLLKSIAFAHFGNRLFTDVRSIATNISFGLSEDGMYPKTNFTAWTATIGYGVPPADKVSLLVIAVISAGLGIPVIIIMFGGIYMCVKKQKNKGYRTLQDVSSSYPQVNS